MNEKINSIGEETQAGKSRPMLCRVVSDKMNKSRVGVIDRLVKHPQYGKYIKRSTKLMFHDENNATKVGDKVLVIPGRPRSHSKRFDLLKIVEEA